MAELTWNPALSRYEMAENGELVFANVRRDGQRLYVDHVEAALTLRGTGAAGRFMEALTAFAGREGLTLVPVCGYAVAWTRRHAA